MFSFKIKQSPPDNSNFDPDYLGDNLVLSEGDTRLTGPEIDATYRLARGRRSHSSGKYYIEFVTNVSPYSYLLMGFASDALPKNDVDFISVGNVSFSTWNNKIYHGDGPGVDYNWYNIHEGIGYIYRLAVDLDTGKFWLAVNDEGWLGGGDPVLGTTPSATAPAIVGENMYPAIATRTGVTTSVNDVTIHAELGNLDYSVPSGFSLY